MTGLIHVIRLVCFDETPKLIELISIGKNAIHMNPNNQRDENKIGRRWNSVLNAIKKNKPAIKTGTNDITMGK